MPTRLELHEYEDREVKLPLGAEQLAALNKAHITATARGGDHYTLRPSSRIGVLTAGDLSVVVRPKIAIERVIFMIAYALDLHRELPDDAPLDRDADVLEAVIPAFVSLTQRAIRRGLLQGYSSEEEALHGVRGRIRFADQLRRRQSAPLPVEVVYDDFTEDIVENRLLHAAIRLLSRLPIRSEASRRSLRRLRPAFAAVAAPSYRRDAVPEVRWQRLNRHYRPAVELARLILEWSSLELRGGEVVSTAFMIDMNEVFERFLRAALRDALGLPDRQWPEQKPPRRLTLDKRNRINLEPDLMWVSPAGRPVFVGDAKYKRIEPDGFKHADVYQMLAYCIATDLPSGLLVYTADEHEPHHYVIKHAGKTIEVTALDLRGSQEAILDDAGRIAGIVHEHRARALGTLSPQAA